MAAYVQPWKNYAKEQIRIARESRKDNIEKSIEIMTKEIATEERLLQMKKQRVQSLKLSLTEILREIEMGSWEDNTDSDDSSEEEYSNSDPETVIEKSRDNALKRIGENSREIAVNVADENLQENIVKNVQENIVENVQENIVENLQENIVENPQENMVGNVQENIVENVQENIVENLEENLQENIGENFEENLQENLDEDLEENVALNIEENNIEEHNAEVHDIEDNIIGENLEEMIENNTEENENREILEEEQNPNVMIDFNEHTYSYAKEQEVFLGMIKWRCDCRARIERNWTEKELQEREWKELKENNQRELEELLKNLNNI
ncbi:ring-infected erythrocyte surface antigen-like [Leptopilina heterotoma]|uniref:ring-infected erythrocyte surface antigen-like n=1 Tax=Leptopilina heterotoma TaxID=63436 RepID=UPI001CA7D9FE|nr:ring-infected erythrocyte surface antigen-like [Leptopilina heterotoma]